jgi:hypothetical protein
MKFVAFFNSFLNSFLFGAVVLSLSGIFSVDVKAQQPTSRITVTKDFCQSIGQSNTCNGNVSFNGGFVSFNVFNGTSSASPLITTINVPIDQANNSKGSFMTTDIFTTGDIVTVCELVPFGFLSTPRPDNSTGGTNQTANGNCITATLVSGNNGLSFLNSPGIAPTSAPATVSGRIREENGKGVPFVLITAVNLSTGEIVQTQSDLRGRYKFESLPTLENFLVTASSRKYSFTPSNRHISLLEDLTNLDFTAEQKWGFLR